MPKNTQRSKCYKAGVRTNGIPDFLGSKEICTINYTCLECNKPCDLVKPKGQKRKTRPAKKSVKTTLKRINVAEKRLDFQGKVLQKLVELLDGITIHPVKGVMLTSKKKRQLAELQKKEAS